MRQDNFALRSMVEERYADGQRVLLFCGYKAEGEADIFTGGPLTADALRPLALVTLENPIRPNALETFQYFENQGVAVKVISGDNPITAALATKQAGIPDAEKYIDLSTVDGQKGITKAAAEYTVFGQVTPEQKSELIRALKKHGHTVAMTGDGVNDVLALKEADCSIAMASGSDAASSVADLVLLNSDFDKV